MSARLGAGFDFGDSLQLQKLWDAMGTYDSSSCEQERYLASKVSVQCFVDSTCTRHNMLSICSSARLCRDRCVVSIRA